MSERHTNDVLLDAARESVLAIGVRRTTAAEVARRAGVSRMTLYRAFPDAASLLAALLARDFGALIERAQAETVARATARERLVEVAALGAELLAANPLFERVLGVDPELLLPYVTDRFGETQRQAMAFFARLLAEGQADGSIRPGEPAALAHCLQLAAQGFVLSVRVSDHEGLREESFRELRTLLDAYLRPW